MKICCEVQEREHRTEWEERLLGAQPVHTELSPNLQDGISLQCFLEAIVAIKPIAVLGARRCRGVWYFAVRYGFYHNQLM